MDRVARYDFWEETSHPRCSFTLHPREWTVRRSAEHEHAHRRSKYAFTPSSLSLYYWINAFFLPFSHPGFGGWCKSSHNRDYCQ